MTGRSGRSKGSRSKKDEINFEEMEIEEVDAMIEELDRGMKDAEKLVKKINSKKVMTEQQKKKEIAPLEEQLKETRDKIMFLLQIKEAKIPFYEKLPKDHQFYKHFMASINTKCMT